MSGRKPANAVLSLVRKYFMAGLLTAVPIWVTWLIFSFLVTFLTNIGAPPVAWLADVLRPRAPALAQWLAHPWFQSTLAVVFICVGLGVLGWITTKVIGRRLITFFDDVMGRIPLVQTIYGAAKKLLTSFQQKPDGVQRVVLINFPSPEMKTVGLVTRTLVDEDTGRKLAAVYVPTTPNPTSGYLEIVPLDKVTSTNWTVDEALNFIVSGGAVAPPKMNYDRSAEAANEPDH